MSFLDHERSFAHPGYSRWLQYEWRARERGSAPKVMPAGPRFFKRLLWPIGGYREKSQRHRQTAFFIKCAEPFGSSAPEVSVFTRSSH
jgi:hypothetical protein